MKEFILGGRGTGGWKKGVGIVGKIEHMKLLT